MKIQVTYNTSLVRSGVHQVTMEADGYQIDPKLGTLQVVRNVRHDAAGHLLPQVVTVFAAGVWRSVSDTTLMIQCIADAMPQEVASENPRRRQEARPIPPT